MMHPTLSRKHVLMLVAQNENDALLQASIGIIHFFNGLGNFQEHTINLLNPNGFDELIKWLETGDVACVCAYAGVGAQLRTKFDKGEILWTHYQVPFISLFYDHPAYNYQQHSVKSPYIINFYHVKDHYDVWKKSFSSCNQAALLKPCFSPNLYARDYKWSERENKILYVKSGLDPASYQQAWSEQPPLIKDILWYLADKAVNDRNLNLVNEVSDIFLKANLSVNDQDMFWGVVQEVDGYIRAWRSDRFARALMSQDAVIIGNGWDYLKADAKKDIFRPAIPASTVLAEISKFRICANTNPLWRHGIHERVGRAIASESIALTDRSIASDKAFGDLENYHGFEWSDNLRDVMSACLESARYDPPDFQKGNDLIASKYAHNYETFVVPGKEALKKFYKNLEVGAK